MIFTVGFTIAAGALALVFLMGALMGKNWRYSSALTELAGLIVMLGVVMMAGSLGIFIGTWALRTLP